MAVYGQEFRAAYTAYAENPDAWEMMNRHTYYDALIDRWSVSLEIIKYNGDRLALEESPASALGLVNGIADALNSVPSDIAPLLIEKEFVIETASLFLQLIDLYAPGLLEEMAKSEEEQESELLPQEV